MASRPTSADQHSDNLAAVTLEARQLLAAVQGYAEMLGEELADRAELHHDLQQIRDAGLRLTELVASLEDQVATARDLAWQDPLTGIANRRAFFDRGESLMHGEAPVCLVLLDVDKFKDINDTHGHLVGDEVLRALVERCLGAIRDGDILARLAGDEFVLLLPGATYDVALAVAARLQQKVSRQPIRTSTGTIPVTVSIGVAERNPAEPSLRALIESADAAMYHVKRTGRDRVA